MSTDITSLANTTSLASKSSSTGLVSEEVMGKEEFLTLLVAQLQNQDPLNPDEGTEFTAQLAQFSSLEQQMSTNEGIQELVQSTTNSDSFALLSTIGKDAVFYSDTFDYTSDTVELGYMLGENASSVSIELQMGGQTISTIAGTELTAGVHTLTWDGLTSSGEAAPVGDYTIVVNATGSDGAAASAAPVLKAEVTGVNLDPVLGSTLNTSRGDIESYAYILGIYDPE